MAINRHSGAYYLDVMIASELSQPIEEEVIHPPYQTRTAY